MFRFNIIRLTRVCLLITGTAMPAGCAGSHWAASNDTVDLGESRSLVTDGEHLSALRTRGDAGAWWQSRNDRGPAVIIGYEAPVIESSFQRVYDRQSSYNGRVHDNYHESSYRTRTRLRIR